VSTATAKLRGTVVALATAGLLAATLVATPATAATTQVTATAGVNIRSGPSTSTKVVGGLYRGQTVTALSSANGWTKIRFAGGTAYIAARYLTTDKIDAPASVTGNRVTTTAVNLRKGPGLTYGKLYVVRENTWVTLTGRAAKGFVEVTISKDRGWISTQYLARSDSDLPAVIGTRVTRANLAIRTSSGADAKVVGEIKKGRTVSITGTTQNGRAQIIYGQAVRWVTAKYLSNTTATLPTAPGLPATVGTRYATADLNLWSSSTGSAHTNEVPRGTAVKITGKQENGRAQIVHSNAVRWVTAKYLSTDEPAEVEEPPSSDVGGNIPASWKVTERKLTAKTIKVHRASRKAFPQIKSVGGWYQTNAGEHPVGRAIDIMIPNYKSASGRELGYSIAEWARKNARALDINYVVWRQHIWNIQRDKEGWRFMADRGDDSSNHLNHVHISVFR
jgi:uncharacterized protein YgiM (DUF1202 family)